VLTLVLLVGCSGPVDVPLGPFCEDSYWTWSEVIVRDPCWDDVGEKWSSPDSHLACLGENRFAWFVGDFVYDCDLQNSAFSCTGEDSRLRGRMVSSDAAGGVWTYFDGQCAVETRFDAVRLR